MYVEDAGQPATGAGSGWAVEPDQVRDFAAAVERVRADLNAIAREVDELASPEFAPMLGTSPVGQEMAEKFSDRMGGESGLRGQLQVALRNLNQFVEGAEKTAASYQATDEDSASGYRYGS
jgi:hypothetical protein